MRQKLIFIVALRLLFSSSVAQFRLQDSPPPTPKLIKAGRILDVTSGKYILNQGSLTEHERIKEVGPREQVQSHAPKGVITIELCQATVLPGLTDCHSHLLVRPTITERSGCITGNHPLVQASSKRSGLCLGNGLSGKQRECVDLGECCASANLLDRTCGESGVVLSIRLSYLAHWHCAATKVARFLPNSSLGSEPSDRHTVTRGL